jgi:hypothetical protein
MMNLMVPFFGAQLVLALVLWVVYYVVRRPPNLAARLRALDDITDTALWAKEGRDELERSLSELATLRAKLAKLLKRLEGSRGLGVGWAQRVFMLLFLGGSWLLLYQSESAIGVILNLTSGFLSLSREQAAFAGPLLAMGAFMISHTAALAAHKPERARRTWRWACAGTFVSLVLVGVAWVVFLSGRTVDVTDVVAATQMEATLTRTLYVLALLNAVAAAFAGTAILLLLEDRFVASEIERMERLIREHAQHVLRVARELKDEDVVLSDDIEEQLEDIKEVASPATPRRPSPLVTVASAVLLALVASGAQAQPAGNPPPTTVTSSLQVPVRGAGTCEVLVDVSLSTDVPARQEAVRLFVQHLDRFIEAKGCRLFRALGFSGDPFARLVEVEIPEVERATDTCATRDHAQPRAVEVWFPKLGEARQQLMIDRCTERLRTAEAATAGRRRQAVSEAGRQVQLLLKDTEARGNCTALDLAIALAHARSREVAAVTDGFSTCPAGPDTDAAEDGGDYSWLTVLVIPRASVDQRWAELAGRIAKLQGRYPGARIRPYNELTGSFWTR